MFEIGVNGGKREVRETPENIEKKRENVKEYNVCLLAIHNYFCIKFTFGNLKILKIYERFINKVGVFRYSGS